MILATATKTPTGKVQLVKPKTKRSSPQRHRANEFCHLVAGLKRGVCVGSGLRLSAVKLSIADHEQERFLLLKHAFTTTDTSTQTPARGITVLKNLTSFISCFTQQNLIMRLTCQSQQCMKKRTICVCLDRRARAKEQQAVMQHARLHIA